MWYEGKVSDLKAGVKRQNSIGILTDDINFFVWVDNEGMIHHFGNQMGGVFTADVSPDGSRMLVLRHGQKMFSLGRIVPCEAGVSRNVFADFDPDNTDETYVMLCRDGVKRVVSKLDGELYMCGEQDSEFLKFKDYTGIVRMAHKQWLSFLTVEFAPFEGE